ncbi:MAG TPA: serine hydrolase [bacterium]|nr:serine hydrolase [bacterium]
MSSSLIDDLMREAIGRGDFPGAALLVAKGGDVLHRGFYGNATLLPKPEPATESTLWDIASLTKPLAAASLAMVSVREKGLSLSSAVSKLLPALDDEEKSKITVRHLLKHTSGLPAWKPYYEEIARERPELVGKRESRPVYVEKISAEALEAPIAYRRIYSDLGFILLGILLEEFWEKGLDDLFAEKIAGPLGLRNTFYVPVGAGSPRPYTEFAATERSEWRRGLIRGEVHDDNAYTLGGVAGHAGLFSTVDDLHAFADAFARGHREGHALFSKDIVDEFVGAKTSAKLGWDTPSPEGSQAGRYFSRHAIGHLGYSGGSLWMDLEKDFHVVLLTNRVHPTSQNEAIKAFRPKIHDLIFEELIREK